MDGEQTPTTPPVTTPEQLAAPSTPPVAEPSTPPADPALAAVMARPPHDVGEVLQMREEHPGLRRVPSAQNLADLATPPAGVAPAPPVRQSRIFTAANVAPNEFKITHQGQDLGGKALTPTEVAVVLSWLNSLPPEF